MNKKVLLIARNFYPSNATGSHRPGKLAKYLPEFGWTPVVLCAEWTPENSGDEYDPILAAQPDVCRTVRVPYPAKPSSKIGRVAYWTLPILFPYRAPLGFTRRMLASAEDLVRHEPFDVIWSTYMPGLTHYVASRIARRHGIPWVADFRDIPDQVFRPLRLWHTVRQEVRACRWAKAIVTVSQPLADCLARRYRAPVHVIPNGFDPDDFPPRPNEPHAKFAISYFGHLAYPQDPRPFFAALDRLMESGRMNAEDVEVRFYATSPRTLKPLVEGFACRRIVQCHPRVPYEEMVLLAQRSAVLLLVGSGKYEGITTSKIFNYLAAGRPTLDVPGSAVTREILEETGAGAWAADAAGIAGLLSRWYDEWKETGTVAYHGIPEKIARYTRKEQTGQLARIFDSVTPGRAGGGVESHSRGEKEAASNAG